MQEYLMEMPFGRGAVRENLERAFAEGRLELLPDGSFSLPPPEAQHHFLKVKNLQSKKCRFFNMFLFHHAYDQTAVPYACRHCYKVKIVPANFRGLIALRKIMENAQYASKCGADFFTPRSRDIYAGYFYLVGLDEARTTYREMRKLVDEHPDLGVTVRMIIKRGCSNMEAACGPSDKWTFRDGMPELESYLEARFKPRSSTPVEYRLRRIESMRSWLQLAYKLGDDTYLDFTGGKPLHRPTVAYPTE
jgi:hypothetical protein